VVPDVPGCFSAGDTLEEALANAREAIAAHLQALSEDGQPVPVPSPTAQDARAEPGFFWASVEV
jgi:predicted RNase H-like HicB family nuclease